MNNLLSLLRTPKFLYVLCATLLLGIVHGRMNAQNTIAITCTGTAGSYKSGSVNAAGVKNDGNLISVNNTANRGWTTYNLASLAGKTIISVTAEFTTYSSGSSTAGNWLKGFTGNPATLSAAALYDSCFTGPTLHFSTWSTNGLQSEEFNSAGIDFIQDHVGGSINIGYTRNSGVNFNIYGYSGTTPPRLIVTYYASGTCMGVPAPGNTLANTDSACADEPFLLSLENQTFAGGITYQWKRADNAAFTTNLVNLGTASTQTVTQTSAKYYRCHVTCSNGASTGISTPLQVPMKTTTCPVYCASSATTSYDSEIFNFSFGTLNNSSNCFSVAPGPGSSNSRYSNYRSGSGAPIAPVVARTEVVPFSYTIDYCNSVTGGNSITVFIDFNQNGNFTDAGEQVFHAYQMSGIYTNYGTITIPATAMLGSTVMRVVDKDVSSISSCGTYYAGETEDYYIQITDMPSCNGVPAPGNTIASCGTYACANSSFTLSLQNPPLAQGITYQWYNSNGAIAGATSATYSTALTATDTFYCMVTCAGSMQTTSSNPIPIPVSFLGCYCTASNVYPGFYLHPGTISNVTFNTINNSSGESGYTNYTNLSTTVYVGQTYPISIYTPNSYYSGGEIVAVWIDFDHNGMGDANEQFNLGGGAGAAPFTGNIPIPLTAFTGTTLMRVRVVDGNSWMSFCGNTDHGEVEDYYVNIAIQPCSGTPSPGNTLASNTVACPNTSVTLSLQNSPLVTGLTYQWKKNNVSISGATQATCTATVTATASFHCVVTCTNSSQSGSSTPVSIQVGPPVITTMVTPSATICVGNSAVIAASGASSYVWQPGGASGASLSVTPSTTTTYTVTGASAQGCTSTATRLITVNSLPTIGTSVSASAICDGGSTTITGTGATTYTLNPGALTGTVFTVAPITTTTYTITGTNAQGCTSSDTRVITVNTLPGTGTTVSATTICTGSSTTITGTGAASYTLNPGALTGNSFIVSPTTITTYTITGLNAAGCTSTSTRTISINQLPTISSIAATPDAITCNGNSILSVNYNLVAPGYCLPDPGSSIGFDPHSIGYFNFNSVILNGTGDGPGDYHDYPTMNANVTAGSSYPFSISPFNSWSGKAIFIDFNQDGDFDDTDELAYTTTPSIPSNSPAYGSVMIPANAKNGMTRMRIVCVYGINPGASYSCSLNSNPGEHEDYRLTIFGGISPATISWLPTTFLSSPTLNTSNVNNINATTTYTVTVTDPVTLCNATATKTITINPLPNVSTATTASTICAGNSTTITGTNANTYIWNPGAFNGTTITVSPTVTTTYTVTGTNTTSGCTSTSTRTIHVLDNVTPTITVPITCTGTSGSFNSGSVNATGTKNDGDLLTLSTTNNRGWTSYDLSELPAGASIISVKAEFTTYNSNSSTAGNWLYGFTGDPSAMSGTDLYSACATSPSFHFSTWTSSGLQSKALNAAGIAFIQANIGGSINLGYVRNSGVNYNIYGYDGIAPPQLIITYNSPCVNTVINLNAFIEGYWNGSNALQPVLFNQGRPNTATQCDSITIELHNAAYPYTLAYSANTLLNTNGTASAILTASISGSYYIVVKSRNGITTWSANPVSVSGGSVSYDFSTAANKAYGSNQVEVSPGIFAFYSGDLNADENIDLLDASVIEADINAFAYGYFATDINGDGNVDLLDTPFIENNTSEFIFSNHP